MHSSGASANAQWYPEIEAFMFPRGSDGESAPRTRADPVEALAEFQKEWLELRRRPTAPEASKFIYGLGAVINLTRTVPMDLLAFDDLLADDREQRALLTAVFALTGGQEPTERTQIVYEERLDAIVDLFANDFNGWEDGTESRRDWWIWGF